MKIGFVGFGNIAIAMVKGLILADPELKKDIYCSAAHYDKCKKNADYLGITALPDNKQTAVLSDMVVLCVKPYQIESVIAELKEELKNKMVVSVAAGITHEHLGKYLDPSSHYIEVGPNTPVSVAKGIIICEDIHTLNAAELDAFTNLFSKIAMLEFVSTKNLAIAESLAGCTPAYTAMYMEALGDAGVKHGLTRQLAYRIAAKMIEGTGAMALSENVHPGALKDAVCSPGGTTIKGVASLEESGFRGSVIKALDAVVKK